jgi:hypothetical protein
MLKNAIPLTKFGISTMKLNTPTLATALSFSVLALLPSAGRAQNFVFPSFTNSIGLQVNGNAAVNQTGQDGTSKVLRLTNATVDQAGSAFSLNTVQLGSNASFSTAFSFQMWDGGGISDGTSNPLGADGIVFVLNTVSNTVGSLGQGVGYQDITHSVGIKFDTWDDSTANNFPQDNDPNGNFVAIYNDGSTHRYDSGNPSDPNNNSATDAMGFYSPSDSMKNGDTWYAWIDYNGTTDELDVRLSETDVRPTNPDLSETIDLSGSSILGSAPNVYAGFTSGTGGAWDNNDILNWQFNDTYNPITTIGNVPDQGPNMGLMAAVLLGLCGLAAYGKRRALVA